MWLVVSVVVLVVLVATYLTLVATRVDRLHAKASAAYTALGSHSVRRATAAAAFGEQEGFSDTLAAANEVLTALEAAPEEWQAAENALTRALRLATAKVCGGAMDTVGPALMEVIDASRRLALARQMHSDLVRDAQAVRRRPLVRMLGLTRRHAEPAFFDIDDPTLDLAD
jgi:hypothetical protein